MRIVCPTCAKQYNIPDNRLPQKKMAKFTCKGCAGIIKLDLHSKTVIDVESTASQHAGSRDEKQPLEQPISEDVDPLEIAMFRKKILRSMKELPPMPQVVSKVRNIMANPLSGFKDISKVIETDQAIAARVLKIANSAFYGMSGQVATIHQASVVLGYETLSEVLTVVGASALLGKRMKGYRMDSGALWRHSLSVAFCSKIIAAMKNPKLENEAFSAGLLHDSAKLVLDDYLFEKKDNFEKFIGNDQNAMLSAEKRFLGFDHAELTFELCKLWHIPEFQTLSIRYHHNPANSNRNHLAYILHTADLLSMIHVIGMDGFRDQIEEDCLDFIGLSEEDFEGIIQETNKSVDTIMQNVL
jgi:HD-like signal output (HDOD) protein